MNKAELIRRISEVSGLTKAAADRVTEAVFATITDTLKSGEDVRLAGFGTFSVTSRSERKGRNPRTGEVIILPASKIPKFSVGKILKEAVNG